MFFLFFLQSHYKMWNFCKEIFWWQTKNKWPLPIEMILPTLQLLAELLQIHKRVSIKYTKVHSILVSSFIDMRLNINRSIFLYNKWKNWFWRKFDKRFVECPCFYINRHVNIYVVSYRVSRQLVLTFDFNSWLFW